MENKEISEFISKKCLSFIQDKLNNISKKNKNVILFGAGYQAKFLLKNFDFSIFNIKALVDSNSRMHGEELFGNIIKSPNIINKMDTNDTGIIIMAYESEENIIEQIKRTVKKDIDIFTLYNKEKGESTDCSLYFYNLKEREKNEKKDGILKELFKSYYTLFDHPFTKKYFNKITKKSYEEKNMFNNITFFEKNLRQKLNDKMNICLVVLDCVRAKNLSCYDYDKKTSPFLDKLKNKSIFFENAFSNSNWTLPSHSTMLTGKIPSEHGAWGGVNARLDEKQIRLPQLLKYKGYQTIGCFSISFMNPMFGTSKGFDFYEQGPIEDLLINPASLIIREAFENIKQHKPFFLMLNFADAHTPYKTIQHEWGNPSINTDRPLNKNLSLEPYDEDELKNTINCYNDGISYMDRQLEYLKSILPENTLFIVTSDHGEVFNEYEGFAFHNDKAGLYDEVIHIPLIIHHPSLKPRIIKDLFPLKNLFRFILDFTDGKENIKTEDYVISESDAFLGNFKMFGRKEFKYNKVGIRTKSYKFILSGDGSKYLFKLPDEKNNLYGKPEYKEISEKLEKIIKEKSKLPLEEVN